jgi:hypothetical protein
MNAAAQGGRLLRSQGGLNRIEVRIHLRPNSLHYRDDRNRDASGDEAVFDGGRTAFVVRKLGKKLHRGFSATYQLGQVWQPPLYQIRLAFKEKMNVAVKVLLPKSWTPTVLLKGWLRPGRYGACALARRLRETHR